MNREPAVGQALISEIYLQEEATNMPARFQSVIMHFSTPSRSYSAEKDEMNFGTNYALCLQQWRMHSISSGNASCCCSKNITHLHYIRNIENNNVLLVGSDCIKKLATGSTLHNEAERLTKFFRLCQVCKTACPFPQITGGCCPNCYEHRTSDKKICHVCLNLRKLNGHTRCKSCWKAGDNNYVDYVVVDHEQDISLKSCLTCGKNFHSDASWKNRCLPCYKLNPQPTPRVTVPKIGMPKIGMPKIGMPKIGAPKVTDFSTGFSKGPVSLSPINPNAVKGKSCTSCSQPFASENDWKTVCPSCYSKNSRSCEKCGKSFYPKVPYAKKCYSCWKA